jgi:hypothetical protein
MGVIHSLKTMYRVKLVRKLLALYAINKKATVKDIELLDALIMLKNSWDEVTQQTIRNCFIKSGFKFETIETDIEESNTTELLDESVWNELIDNMGIECANFEEHINVDNDVFTSEEITDDVILNNVNSDNALCDKEVDDEETEIEESESDEEQRDEPINMIEALNAISQLRKYVIQFDSLESGHYLINNLENLIYHNRENNSTQSKITSFFQKPL